MLLLSTKSSAQWIAWLPSFPSRHCATDTLLKKTRKGCCEGGMVGKRICSSLRHLRVVLPWGGFGLNCLLQFRNPLRLALTFHFSLLEHVLELFVFHALGFDQSLQFHHPLYQHANPVFQLRHL